MQLNNIELVTLIETLKTTKAYNDSRELKAEQEGKCFLKFGNRDKTSLVWLLVKDLEQALDSTKDLPSSKSYSLELKLVEAIGDSITLEMPQL